MPKHDIPPQEAQDVGYEISNFYLKKHNFVHPAAQTEVENLRITSIEVDDEGDVTIYLGRPGLLIGAKGKNIGALSAFLNRKIKIVEAFHWDEIVVPYDYSDY